MKKILVLLAVGGMLSFYACGPSAEEKAAMDKKRADSTENANKMAAEMQKAREDSAAAAQKAMEDAQAEALKRQNDSLEAAAAKKPAAKPAPKKPGEVKAGSGKG